MIYWFFGMLVALLAVLVVDAFVMRMHYYDKRIMKHGAKVIQQLLDGDNIPGKATRIKEELEERAK